MGSSAPARGCSSVGRASLAQDSRQQLVEHVAAIRENARAFAVSVTQGDQLQAASELWAALQATARAIEDLDARICAL